MSTLSGRRILLVIGGGIAAFKALDLIRRMRERGASVHVVLTEAAQHFVTPLSAAALSGTKVFTDLFSLTDEAEMGHIELSRAADLIVVVPATADLLAKMAHGLADDLASTLLLATDKRILVAPAMNLRMWLHPATQRNLAALRADGTLFCGPVDGDMACGEYGPGRMSEPLEIVAAIEAALAGATVIPLPHSAPKGPGALVGKKVVVTCGPTHEPIDPVRYIANRSSGRQGQAIAQAAAAAGAEVVLISGPVNLPDPPHIETLHVETAQEMLQAVESALPADIFIAAAAVADWRVATASEHKIKKGGDGVPTLALVENPDILATIAGRTEGRPSLVIGFAAETENVVENAEKKLARKGCDLVVANDVRPESGIMGGDSNAVTLVGRAGHETWHETWPRASKGEVGHRLIAHLVALLKEKTA